MLSNYLCLEFFSVLLVDQHISISGLSFMHVNNSLVCVCQRSLLNDWVNLLVNSEPQHSSNISWGPDGRSSDLASLSDKCESTECWNLILRSSNLFGTALACFTSSSRSNKKTYLDELSHCSKQLEVLLEWHVWAGDRGNDEVQ
jgi:hypothetical protein